MLSISGKCKLYRSYLLVLHAMGLDVRGIWHQNAWDLRKFCAYKRDNAVWNYFRNYFITHFQDNQVPSFGLLTGVFWENLPLHLC